MEKKVNYVGMISEKDFEEIKNNERFNDVAEQNLTWMDATCHGCGTPGKALISSTIEGAVGDLDDLGVRHVCGDCADQGRYIDEMVVRIDPESLSWCDRLPEEERDGAAGSFAKHVMMGRVRVHKDVDEQHWMFSRIIKVLIDAMKESVAEEGAPEFIKVKSRHAILFLEKAGENASPALVVAGFSALMAKIVGRDK